jgi:hypothetical protein
MTKSIQRKTTRTLRTLTDAQLRQASGGATAIEYGDGHVLAFHWGVTITRLG